MTTPYHTEERFTLYHGDALDIARQLPAGAADCIVTSPPYYGLRDYGADGQYGMEASPAEYVETMRDLFAELRRVLADDGTLWLNIGDSYASKTKGSGGTEKCTLGSGNSPNYAAYFEPRRFNAGVPDKNLLGIPWRVAFALQDDGWILRNAIIWNKPNAMPESVTDRLSGRYEHVFLFAKNRRYWFDLDPIREKPLTNGGFTWEERKAMGHENGRNPGDVWTLPTQPFPGAHFAVYPIQLPQRCILAGCKPGGTVLDPFNGSGTTGRAAIDNGRRYIGIDLNAEYLDLSIRSEKRLGKPQFSFDDLVTITKQEKPA